MNRKILLSLLLLILIIAGYLMWDPTPPEVVMENSAEVGPETTFVLEVADQGKGLASVEVTLRQGEMEKLLRKEEFAPAYFPWESSRQRILIEIGPDEWMDRDLLKEGEFELHAVVTDAGDYGLFSDTTDLSFAMELDTTPPGIQILSSQHNVRRGGAETVRYRVLGNAADSGVRAGEHSFVGYPTDEGREGEYAVIFVWPHDDQTEEGFRMWAEDAAGNRMEISLPCQKIERKFRQRRINVGDSFINRVTPEIVRLSPDVDNTGDGLQTYLKINQDLRRINNRKITEVTGSVTGGISWEEAFLQMRNSKVEALFADHRSYFYGGEKVDEQVHLGYDLASTANSPVEAANNGTVAFAENLGIYGNCVIIDHGLGVYSLYGHLSTIDTRPGNVVSRGEVIGSSGQTGLAGGDHLHFSMLVQGVQTNPLEWWDPSWIKLHVLNRLKQVDLQTNG